jgi:hypothetical protein
VAPCAVAGKPPPPDTSVSAEEREGPGETPALFLSRASGLIFRVDERTIPYAAPIGGSGGQQEDFMNRNVRAAARRLLVATAVAGLSASAADAQVRTQVVQYGDAVLKASSRIVGVTSTATLAAGGDPIYFPSYPASNGVVALIMEFDNGAFICSGSLIKNGSILTAAHCVTDSALKTPNKTTAWFYGGPDPDTIVPLSGVPVEIKHYFIHPDYTGEVIDQNDIAVLRLAGAAPGFATVYDLFWTDSLTGVDFNVQGYGRRSLTGGAVGANLGTGRLRQGDNRFDSRLGDPDYGGFWDGFFGTADVTYSYLSDFDNGLAANDASCFLAAFAGVAGLPNAKYCDLGRGAREVSVAGGDSGGPQFVDGRIAAITSYGLTGGLGFGDVDNFLNSSFGELNGFVPIYIHKSWIASVVPEPGTWAMLIAGFGLVGFAARRRRETAAA